MPNCILCKLLRKIVCETCEAHQEQLWQRTRAWEGEHTNGGTVAAHEPDYERLLEILELHKSDPATALREWHDLAKQGSIWSMYYIGWAYEHGSGTGRDLTRAEEWYDRASGYQYALLCCARLAAARRDYAACEAILKIGVEQDWAPAEFRLGWYKLEQSRSRRTAREVRPLLERAAAHGHPMAQLLLAQLMAWGRFGLSDIPRGFRMIIGFSGPDTPQSETSSAVGEEDRRMEQAPTA